MQNLHKQKDCQVQAGTRKGARAICKCFSLLPVRLDMQISFLGSEHPRNSVRLDIYIWAIRFGIQNMWILVRASDLQTIPKFHGVKELGHLSIESEVVLWWSVKLLLALMGG